MLRIAICDDEQPAISIVRSMLSDTLTDVDGEVEILDYLSSEALWNAFQSGLHFDLLLLDIDMPGINGISLSTRSQNFLRDTLLIYISNRDDKVFEAFRTSPFRFIRKSYLRDEWPEAIQAALAEINYKKKGKARIAFPYGKDFIYLAPEEIVYAESVRKKQLLHIRNQTVEINSTFYGILEALDGFGFLQIHKSYAVNFRFIRSIGHMWAELDNGIKLPVGRAYVQAAQEKFQRLVMNVL